MFVLIGVIIMFLLSFARALFLSFAVAFVEWLSCSGVCCLDYSLRILGISLCLCVVVCWSHGVSVPVFDILVNYF